MHCDNVTFYGFCFIMYSFNPMSLQEFLVETLYLCICVINVYNPIACLLGGTWTAASFARGT